MTPAQKQIIDAQGRKMNRALIVGTVILFALALYDDYLKGLI